MDFKPNSTTHNQLMKMKFTPTHIKELSSSRRGSNRRHLHMFYVVPAHLVASFFLKKEFRLHYHEEKNILNQQKKKYLLKYI